MRFIHVADVHLDTSFAGRTEDVRRRLREASHEAFRRAVDLAIREDVHAFLIAGDLFDGERLSFATERFLLEQIHRLGDHGITTVYAAGNHDPGSGESGLRPMAWPASVRVASDATPQRIVVHDHEGDPVAVVTAIGHASSRESDDLSRRFPPPQGELPEVALIHTQVHASLGAEEHHPYAPSELTYLMRAGYDYWALGHVHTRQVLSEDPPIAYPGSLQGKTHADIGPRGALLVDLSDRAAPAISFRPLAPVRWETLRVDGLEEADALDRREREGGRSWGSAGEDDTVSDGTEWMVRVILAGPSPLWRELRREEDRDVLAGELRDLLGVLDVVIVADGIHPVVPVEEHRNRPDVLGEALRLLEAVRRKEVKLASPDPGALAGVASDEPRVVEAYVRELLGRVDGELTARLLGADRGPA
jgi:DNA repair exonuclease SbcCD nuclease subunit